MRALSAVIRRSLSRHKKKPSALGARRRQRKGVYLLCLIISRQKGQDKTALKMMEELPSVVVAGVGTIPRPEKWIRIFDAVRGLAKQCERPELIFDEWEWRYKNGGHDYFSMDIDEIIDDESVKAGAGDPLCILRWIRETVRIQAKKAGLL